MRNDQSQRRRSRSSETKALIHVRRLIMLSAVILESCRVAVPTFAKAAGQPFAWKRRTVEGSFWFEWPSVQPIPATGTSAVRNVAVFCTIGICSAVRGSGAARPCTDSSAQGTISASILYHG